MTFTPLSTRAKNRLREHTLELIRPDVFHGQQARGADVSRRVQPSSRTLRRSQSRPVNRPSISVRTRSTTVGLSDDTTPHLIDFGRSSGTYARVAVTPKTGRHRPEVLIWLAC